MGRIVSMVLVILSCTIIAGAETVSLNGTVKKTGGTTGLAGVKVSLARLPNFSATTGTDGAFSLTGNTAKVKFQTEPNEPIKFMIKGNTMTFAPIAKGVTGRVAVFTSTGRMQSSFWLHDRFMGKQSMTLPRFSPGVYFMRCTVGSEVFLRTLVCVGNTLTVRNDFARTKQGTGLIIAKQLAPAAVDTLIAEKNGYRIKKTPIQSYTMDGIEISLDSSSGCTRETLKMIADGYLAAQKKGDPSTLPLASQVTYLQNNKTVAADKCIWNTAMPIDFSLSLLDVDSCRAFVEVISSTGSTPRVMIVWLKVIDDKISGVDAMVTTTGDFMFNANKYLTYAKAQDWNILTESQKVTRQEVVRGADAYLNMFKAGVDSVPWGHPCERIEGGNMHITPDCIQGMPGHGGSGNIDVINRRYAVDVEMGTVDIFCSFMNMPDSHMFRLVEGKLRLVHTLTVQNK